MTGKYKIGDMIKLLQDIDDIHPIFAGECGIIDHIDDIGTIHVRWENGRLFGLIPDVDSFEIISTSEK